MLAEDGQAVSSLLVFEADSLEEAEEWMRQDPYYQAGVWKETRVLRFRAVVGDWAGADAVL